jgi:peptide/nickel transport system substrate-binding protein
MAKVADSRTRRRIRSKRAGGRRATDLTRRTFLCGLAAASSAMAVGGWGKEAFGPGLEHAFAQTSGARGNTFILPVNGDPYRWPFLPAIPNILFNETVYSGLVKYGLDGVTPKPDLAESWSTPDAKVWTFKLRRDVRWHDGRPFTAEDVKFTFDAMLDPKWNVTNRGILVTLKQTDIVDPYTVRLVFPEPVAALPVGIGYIIFILPKHLLTGVDLNNPVDFLKHPIGTGAFQFKEFVAGDHTTVVPYPGYHGGRAKVDAVIFRQVPDLNVQVAQLLAGELDVSFPEIQQLNALKKASNVSVKYTTPIQYFFIGLNNRNPLFAEKTVRQALAHAVDRQAIISTIVQGEARLATGPINPAIRWAYNPRVTTYAYDAAKARSLLTQAGWKPGAGGVLEKDGKPFSFTLTSTSGNSTRQQINTVLQQYYRAVGVQVRLEFLEPNVFDQRFFAYQFDALMHFSNLMPDPDLTAYYATGRPELFRLLESQGR